jgi:hypothetical protein
MEKYIKKFPQCAVFISNEIRTYFAKRRNKNKNINTTMKNSFKKRNIVSTKKDNKILSATSLEFFKLNGAPQLLSLQKKNSHHIAAACTKL